MLIRDRKRSATHKKKMERLFRAADLDGNDFVDIDAFVALCDDPFIKSWLTAYELDVSDAELIFNILDRGDGHLSAEDLLSGVSKLRGTARSQSEGFPIVDYFVLGRDGISVGQDSRVIPASSLTILEF